jgi:tRNA (guanine37-N1)-methyltransferase
MVMIETIVRLLPGVLGNPLSIQDESFSSDLESEYGHYTRPRDFEGHEVPEVLVRGNHKEIANYRAAQSKNRAKGRAKKISRNKD